MCSVRCDMQQGTSRRVRIGIISGFVENMSADQHHFFTTTPESHGSQRCSRRLPQRQLRVVLTRKLVPPKCPALQPQRKPKCRRPASIARRPNGGWRPDGRLCNPQPMANLIVSLRFPSRQHFETDLSYSQKRQKSTRPHLARAAPLGGPTRVSRIP